MPVRGFRGGGGGVQHGARNGLGDALLLLFLGRRHARSRVAPDGRRVARLVLRVVPGVVALRRFPRGGARGGIFFRGVSEARRGDVEVPHRLVPERVRVLGEPRKHGRRHRRRGRARRAAREREGARPGDWSPVRRGGARRDAGNRRASRAVRATGLVSRNDERWFERCFEWHAARPGLEPRGFVRRGLLHGREGGGGERRVLTRR